jgi:hypothetical protein
MFSSNLLLFLLGCLLCLLRFLRFLGHVDLRDPQSWLNASRPSTCIHSEYTTIAKLILHASNKVNDGHTVATRDRTKSSRDAWTQRALMDQDGKKFLWGRKTKPAANRTIGSFGRFVDQSGAWHQRSWFWTDSPSKAAPTTGMATRCKISRVGADALSMTKPAASALLLMKAWLAGCLSRSRLQLPAKGTPAVGLTHDLRMQAVNVGRLRQREFLISLRCHLVAFRAVGGSAASRLAQRGDACALYSEVWVHTLDAI